MRAISSGTVLQAPRQESCLLCLIVGWDRLAIDTFSSSMATIRSISTFARASSCCNNGSRVRWRASERSSSWSPTYSRSWFTTILTRSRNRRSWLHWSRSSMHFRMPASKRFQVASYIFRSPSMIDGAEQRSSSTRKAFVPTLPTCRAILHSSRGPTESRSPRVPLSLSLLRSSSARRCSSLASGSTLARPSPYHWILEFEWWFPRYYCLCECVRARSRSKCSLSSASRLTLLVTVQPGKDLHT